MTDERVLRTSVVGSYSVPEWLENNHPDQPVVAEAVPDADLKRVVIGGCLQRSNLRFRISLRGQVELVGLVYQLGDPLPSNGIERGKLDLGRERAQELVQVARRLEEL